MKNSFSHYLNLRLSYPKFGNGTDCLSFFDPADEKEIEVKVFSYNTTKDEYIRNIVYKHNVFTFRHFLVHVKMDILAVIMIFTQ